MNDGILLITASALNLATEKLKRDRKAAVRASHALFSRAKTVQQMVYQIVQHFGNTNRFTANKHLILQQ